MAEHSLGFRGFRGEITFAFWTLIGMQRKAARNLAGDYATDNADGILIAEISPQRSSRRRSQQSSVFNRCPIRNVVRPRISRSIASITRTSVAASIALDR